MITSIHKHYAKQKGVSLRSVWLNPWHFVACGFGFGTCPIVPGTVGTALGVLIAWLLSPLVWYANLSVVLILLIFGAYICGRFNRDVGTDDHPAAVFDEVASFPLVMLGVPFHAPYVIVGFLLFRVLDMLKPPPISWVDQHVKGGLGVMLDDVVAAFGAWCVVFIWSHCFSV
jgi:phosphatidylglycerophosphatase A